MCTINSRIRKFLEQDDEVEIDKISDTDTLFTSGLIDSYSLIELLSFMESEFGYVVDFEQLTIDDFDTIEALVNLVQQEAKLA